jgi:hypothetical protein
LEKKLEHEADEKHKMEQRLTNEKQQLE